MLQVDLLPKAEAISGKRYDTSGKLKISIERRDGTIRYYENASIHSTRRIAQLAHRAARYDYWSIWATVYGLDLVLRRREF